MLLVRYAEGKEAVIVVSAMLPSALTRNIDLYMNIAVPNFNSCTARFQAIERLKRTQYDVSISPFYAPFSIIIVLFAFCCGFMNC